MKLEVKTYPGQFEQLLVNEIDAHDLSVEELEDLREHLYYKVELSESEQIDLLCSEIKSIVKLINKTNTDENGVITHTIKL